MNRVTAILILVIGASPSVSGATAGRGHLVPYMPAATDERRQGFVRVVNHGDESGTVEINAFDDAGDRFGPVSLLIGALETRHFNSDDLETGNAVKGLSSGTRRAWWCSTSSRRSTTASGATRRLAISARWRFERASVQEAP